MALEQANFDRQPSTRSVLADGWKLAYLGPVVGVVTHLNLHEGPRELELTQGNEGAIPVIWDAMEVDEVEDAMEVDEVEDLMEVDEDEDAMQGVVEYSEDDMDVD